MFLIILFPVDFIGLFVIISIENLDKRILSLLFRWSPEHARYVSSKPCPFLRRQFV